jgi:hypothetical protein
MDDRYLRTDFVCCVREQFSSELLEDTYFRLTEEQMRRKRELGPDLYPGTHRAP